MGPRVPPAFTPQRRCERKALRIGGRSKCRR
jgi:hypothetical protein